MGRFNRDNRSGRGVGGRRFDSNRGGGGMHQAICDECGEPCQVPFKPTGDKPIYCDACFGNKKDSSRRSDRRDFGGRDSGRGAMHQATCDECGKTCEVPFRPTSGKPVYCDDCFGSKRDQGRGGRSDRGNRGGDQSKDVLNSINAKLDKILKVLIPETKFDKPSSPVKEVVNKKVSKEKVVEAVNQLQAEKAEPKKGAKKVKAQEAEPKKAEPKKKASAKKTASKKTTAKKAPAKKKK